MPDWNSALMIVILACLTPIIIYLVKPRTKGRRLFGIVGLITVLSIIAFSLLLNTYQEISPPLFLFFLFLVIGVSLHIGRKRA